MVDKLKKLEILETLQQVTGIGPKLAASVWAEFGTQTPAALIEAPLAVAARVRGVSLRRAEAARELFLRRASRAAEAADSHDLATAGGASEQVDANAEGLIDMDRVRLELNLRGDEIHRQRLRAEEVLARHIERLRLHPNVSGAHVGLRRRKNDRGDAMITADMEVCIRVHVPAKFQPNDPRFEDPRLAIRLDSEIEGIPVDVLQNSYTTLDPPVTDVTADASAVTGFEDPIVGGIEIAAASAPNNRGTLGGLVRTGFRFLYITNQHVVGKSPNVVTQPAASSLEQVSALNIGQVIDSEMPGANETGLIDCAIVRPIDAGRRFARLIKDLPGPQRFDSSFLSAADVHYVKAIKVGAVTGVTSGIVKSVNAFVRIGSASMVNQIIVESEQNHEIIRGGDSGALLLTEMLDADQQTLLGFNVVGLVHARSEDNRMMIATHFKAIADRFNVKI